MQRSVDAKTAQPVCENKTAAHFFMSAHTPSGYVSRFNSLYDAAEGWRAYILKSAPGAVAQLLSKAGKRFEDAGFSVEYIHCVSDPDGVAAVVVPEIKTCIIDGMPPHCINPKFPGVVEEEVMLFSPDFERLISKRDQILQFAARAAAFYDRAYRFLSAASSLQGDTFRIASEHFDSEAVDKYTTGVTKRLLSPHKGVGGVKTRYLSGLTAKGVVSYYDNVAASYNRVFAIEDEYGVSRMLLSMLRDKAVAAGHKVISCENFMSEGPEHLLIPDASVAFVTSNSYHRAEGKACRHINIKRFMDTDSMRLKKARIGFNRRAARELYNQAVSLLVEAKANDDIVRDCYKPYDGLDKAQKKVDALVGSVIEKAKAQSQKH